MDPTLRRRRSDDSRSRQLAVSKDPARDAPSHDSKDNHRPGKATLNKITITFSLYENVELDMPHDDALIITIDLVGVFSFEGSHRFRMRSQSAIARYLRENQPT
ncbi:RNA-directed DNA polymerase [Raphanus sativus]|nr:RNA-directed DNA polymerase [Raphanus sativus]